MSHYRLKTTFNTEGSYGSTEKNTLYAHHNLGCDYVTFYDQDGSFIMTVPDTMDNNLLDAINRLYAPFDNANGPVLREGVEYMTLEESNKILK